MVNIRQVLEEVNSLVPNAFTNQDKIKWLNKLDGQIYKDIVQTHEKPVVAAWKPYDPSMPEQDYAKATLIADDDHSELYRFWLESRIHYYSQEYDKYNAATAMFHDAFNEYSKDYNATHMPLQAPFVWF